MGNFAITGGAGFLGAAVAHRLGNAGHRVRVLDDFSGAESASRAGQLETLPMVTVTQGDVRDPDACRSLLQEPDTVLMHFAAPANAAGDSACVATIVGGTLNLLDAARASGSIRRFVLASHGAVYGDGPSSSRHEASLPEPASPRACAALSAEHFCQAVFRREGMQTVCLRYFEVYGPGMNLDPDPAESSLAGLISAAASDGEAKVFGETAVGRDYLYIEDAVEGAVRASAAMRGVGGKIFNVGSGQRISLDQAREMLEKITGHPLTLQRVPIAAGMGWQGRADTAAAAGLLQFTATTGFSDGLARTLHWTQSQLSRERELCHS